MLWSRKATPTHERTRHAGIDLTSSRILGVSVGSGKVRPFVFGGQSEELPLFIALDRRSPEVGRAGYSLCRKIPHTVCSNFLPDLAQSREWRFGRHVLTPESALELALLKIREPILAESETAVLALPAYLAPVQVSRVVAAATKTKFPLKGTAIGPLALVAMRAALGSTGKPVTIEEPPPADWVIRMRRTTEGPGVVVVVDVDEYALSAVVVAVERDKVRLLSAADWPRFSQKAWKDRLLDSVSDRCVRLCRRDPRDSADAEQSLFEQLDEALDRVRAGQRVNLTVRTAHWFQDVPLQPEEFDAHCSVLARGASEAIREMLAETSLPVPPREIWLTHEANRLPGLFQAIHQGSHEGTSLEALPRGAVAHAAAALVPRWLTGELPRAHLDSVIPLPAVRTDGVGEKPKTSRK
jgi:antitoxin (DNA-binding transcriptional repressor) of toxin-antitoxin stability system